MGFTSGSLKQLALQKFKKDFWGVFSFCFLELVGIVSIFAYVLAPDNSRHANQMHLSIHSKQPGFKVQLLTLPCGLNVPQSIFDKVLCGEHSTHTALHISNYTISKDTVVYAESAADGLLGPEDTVPFQMFPNNSVEGFINEKT